jgi:hypothetical protein
MYYSKISKSTNVGFINAALHYRIEMPMIAIEKILLYPLNLNTIEKD